MHLQPPDPALCLTLETGADVQQLARLAEAYGFQPCKDAVLPEFELVLTAQRLELRQVGKGAPGAVFVDFVGGTLAHRRRFGGGRGQPLARAVGVKPRYSPRVFDATAGLGRDAFVLACIGCRVTLCERVPALAALLDDAIHRARAEPALAAIVARMDLQWADARDRLAELHDSQCPDVVYLDPMYPAGRSTALVKKEMQAVQRLVGPDIDSASLFAVALERARRRVVVKRPAAAGWLHARAPSTSISSKKTRYDIYVRT
jgi:16S rRNA (guanine1516-N2)-methyltransferase